MLGFKKIYSVLFFLYSIIGASLFFPKIIFAGGGPCNSDADCGGVGQYNIPCECTGSACGYFIVKCVKKAGGTTGTCNSQCIHSGGGSSYGCSCGSHSLAGCTPSCSGANRDGTCGLTNSHPPKQKYNCTGVACDSCPTCNTTTPSGVTVTPLSATSAQVNWTPGTNGANQIVYVGDDKVSVESNCPNGTTNGSGCVLADVLPSTDSSDLTGDVLTPGNIYYYRIVNFKDASCTSIAGTVVAISSCDLSPSSTTIQEGTTANISSTVQADTSISSVTFTGNNTYISENPGSTNTYPYETTVTGVKSTGSSSTPLTSSVYVTGNASPICTATSAITVTPAGPWWQVVDGDITTMGDIASKVPGGNYFELVGAGAYPGVPAYGGATTLDTTSVSQLGWIAKSAPVSSKIFDSSYFNNLIPQGTIINTLASNVLDQTNIDSATVDPSTGYYWIKFDGSANGLPGDYKNFRSF